jgi:two-component system chemotaxis sensor kinase CheA
MRIRMVKLRGFQQVSAYGEGLKQKIKQRYEFEVEGQDTELDRTILDEISDPLVHL